MAESAPPRPPVVASPTLRRATPADAARLAAFAARVFRETYGPTADPTLAGGSRAEDVEAYVGPHFAPAHQAAELADPTLATFLAESHASSGGSGGGSGGAPAVLAGYAQLRAPSPHPVAGPAAAELARLYVDGPWQGRGVADALVAAALDAAAAAGAPAVWLAVLQRNARAVGFYRRHGFAVAGTSTFRMGAEVQDDWIMVRER